MPSASDASAIRLKDLRLEIIVATAYDTQGYDSERLSLAKKSATNAQGLVSTNFDLSVSGLGKRAPDAIRDVVVVSQEPARN